MPDTDDRPRLLVMTDIGGDPDDEQSLVRLLVYAAEFDIEGIVPDLWAGHKGRHGELTPETQMDVVREALRRYGEVRESLSKNASGYPSEDSLLGVLKRGAVNVPQPEEQGRLVDVSHLVGPARDSEGSDWIVSVVDRPDPRPVNISIWGGSTGLAQALWKVRHERSPEELRRFLAKIRVHAIGDQDETGPWIRQQFPKLFYILGQARDGDKMHSCYRGMFLGGDESLTSRRWADTHVRNGHGPLGQFYPDKTWTGPNPHGCLKEGDTPSWFYFLSNGLQVPSNPTSGGWGGRFEPNGAFWQDGEDTVAGETSHRATVWRWRPAFQNDFQARMDWCVSAGCAANHNPVAVVNGDESCGTLRVSTDPGRTVELDAGGSHDPDGDSLSYHWWVYPEAGTYTGQVAGDGAASMYERRSLSRASMSARVRVVEDAGGRTIHVILEVTDDGDPPLTSYRRVVINTE